jgi:hypothetical protein
MPTGAAGCGPGAGEDFAAERLYPDEGADHAAGDIAVTDPEAPADVDSLVDTLAGFPAASCAATSATVEPIRLGDAPIDLIKSGHDASVKHRVPAREPLASLC